MPSSTAAAAAAGKPRIRSSRACATCVARKSKCDGTELCGECRYLGVPCFYLPTKGKRGPPKGCEARGGVRKKVKDDDVSNAPAPATTSRLKKAKEANAVTKRETSSAPGPTPPFQVESDGRIQTPQGSSSSGSSSWVAAQNESAAYPPPADWTHFPSDIDDHRRASASLDPSLLAAAVPPSHASGSSSSSNSDTYRFPHGLPDHVIDSVLHIYETYVHPMWPVVYTPALRSLRVLDTKRPIVFDAILAVSLVQCEIKHRHNGQLTHVTLDIPPKDSAEHGADGQRYIRHTPIALSEQLSESVRRRAFAQGVTTGTLATVQALILIANYDLGHGRSSSAYQIGGFAIRMACDLGLNTIPDGDGHGVMPDAGPPSRASDVGADREERKRTLWACYVLDKILAAILQRPAALRLDAITTARPSEMERDEWDLLMDGNAREHFLHPSAWASMDFVKSHSLSTFNAWCDVLIILAKTLDTLYAPAAYDARIRAAKGAPGALLADQERFVEQIDAELAQWRRALPAHLQWSDPDSAADGEASAVQRHVPVAPHMLMIRHWYHNCQILVHRPRVPHLYYQTLNAPRPYTNDMDAVEALRMLKRDTSPPPSASGTSVANGSPGTSRPRSSGLESARRAADNICREMEMYEKSFKVRRFPSSWAYIVFHAGTVHAGLALPPSTGVDAKDTATATTALPLDADAAQSSFRLDQCMRWLDQIGKTWLSASHHGRLLRQLSEVGAQTRPSRSSLAKDEGTQLRTMNDVLWTGAAASTTASPVPHIAHPTPYNSNNDRITPHASGDAELDAFAATLGAETTGANASEDASGATTTAQTDLLTSWSLFWARMPTTSEDATLWQDFSGVFD